MRTRTFVLASLVTGCLWSRSLVVGAWAAVSPTPEAVAVQILRATGVRGGLVVHVGCVDGRLTAALRATDSFVVQGLVTDPKRLEPARQYVKSRGLYGPVSVELLTGRRLPYADDLVRLLVVSQPEAVEPDECLRVLAPGGVAYVRQADGWKKVVKPWPDDLDGWTHWMHGPDNNAVAHDRRVAPPTRLQWKAEPLWGRSHNGVPSTVVLVLSAGGRLFSVLDEGLTGQAGLPELWTLVARDAFSGVLLWKRRLPRRPPQRGLVASQDRLYGLVDSSRAVVVLDAATGERLQTFESTRGTRELVLTDWGLLVCVVGGSLGRASRRGDRPSPGKLVAVEARTGRLAWTAEIDGLTSGSLAASDGRVCFHDGRHVVCLDGQTGRRLWTTQEPTRQLVWPLFLYRGTVVVPASGGLRVFALDDGRLLWTGPSVHKRLGVFGANGLVWVSRLQEEGGRTFLWTPGLLEVQGFDPRTGQLKKKLSLRNLITPGHHIRCYPAKCTDRFLVLPKRGAEYVDLVGHQHMRNNWFRPACRHGLVLANGLTYSPPHVCFCYRGVLLSGFLALAGDADRPERTVEVDPTGRLVRGPAFGDFSEKAAPADKPTPNDWPMYRHDERRSGRAGCEVPVRLERLWQTDVGGQLTQPVVAEGRLVVADKDAHTVLCLDAATGRTVWSFTAGARVDSSPTLHRGRVLFGSTDGWLYCLRLTDGALVWRFRAAPQERRVVVFDQLESPWPVHGSVLVKDDVVYATAGRSSFLDGGIWVYGLSVETGEVLYQTHLQGPWPDVTRQPGRPFDMEGAQSDLLVTDGQDLYLGQLRFNTSLARLEAPRITKLGDRKVGLHLMSNAGFLDTTWYDRNFWMYSRRWPGYYFGYNAPKTGQILVFDETTTYGLHVFDTRQGHAPRFWPGRDGYQLFADWNENEPVLPPTEIGREKGDGYHRSLPPKWIVRVPVRMKALVLAGDLLFGAGPPDVVPQDDPMAAFEGRLGARLWVVSTRDGRKLAEYELERPPVFDGLIAAGGRLYVALDNGRLVCLGAAD